MIDFQSNINNNKLSFIDLFAGAGGLSEGFVQAGFNPIAHVESDPAAAFSLRTREAFHKLSELGSCKVYDQYLAGRIDREELYQSAFPTDTSNVINAEISTVNLPSIFAKIDKLLGNKKTDVIIGGPPCQAYSLVGRARSELSMIGDQRNYLFVHYAQFLKRYRPKYFVFENVVGLLSARDKFGDRYLDKMLKLFNSIGYKVELQTLSSHHYGVLQKRKRVILIGRKGRKSDFFPHIQKWTPNVVVNDAIKDLPHLKAGEGVPGITKLRRKSDPWLNDAGILNRKRTVTWHQARPHNERDLKIFAEVICQWNNTKSRLDYNDLAEELKTHKNRKSFLDRFKVVASDLKESHTIVAHISKDGNYYIHPDIHQNRSLSPREAARIQTFPDDFYFESASGRPSRTAAFKQIGNAVPVLLAKTIAKALKDQWV